MKDQDRKQYKTGSGNDPIHDQDTYITKGSDIIIFIIYIYTVGALFARFLLLTDVRRKK